jgi:NAD(P)-dependent dehydrogenase (short-subunit alcohol dehydrogenase family)
MKKTIYVTGGRGLIGRSVCMKFQSEGYECVALDVCDPEYETAKDTAMRTELFDVSDVSALKERINSFFHDGITKPDVWVNCAYPRTDKFGTSCEGNLDYQDWRHNVDVQMNSTCFISSEVAQLMSKSGGGAIVNVASIYGMRAPRFEIYDETEMSMPPAYSAIKAGIINYSRQLAVYYADQGVRINCVSPGGVYSNQERVFLENYSSAVPIGRLATPDEVAAPIFFLSSDDASYITGVNIPVDGGWTAT